MSNFHIALLVWVILGWIGFIILTNSLEVKIGDPDYATVFVLSIIFGPVMLVAALFEVYTSRAQNKRENPFQVYDAQNIVNREKQAVIDKEARKINKAEQKRKNDLQQKFEYRMSEIEKEIKSNAKKRLSYLNYKLHREWSFTSEDENAGVERVVTELTSRGFSVIQHPFNHITCTTSLEIAWYEKSKKD